MKIDFTIVLHDQDDQPFIEAKNPNDPQSDVRPLTLGSVALRSLAAQERGISPEDTLMRGQLALSVYTNKEAELKSEQISLIKGQIAKFYNPIIVVRAYEILDPK